MKQQKRALKPYNYEKTAAFFQTAVRSFILFEHQRAIKNPLRDLRLAHHRQRLLHLSFVMSVTMLVSAPKPAPGARDVVGHDQIEMLATASLPTRVRHYMSLRLRRKADTSTLPGLLGTTPSGAGDIRVFHQREVSAARPRCFLSFCGAGYSLAR